MCEKVTIDNHRNKVHTTMAAQLIVIILLTTLCFVAQVSTIGDFYQPSRGNREETLSLSNSNKRIRKSLKEPVDMYGTKYADIYVSVYLFFQFSLW